LAFYGLTPAKSCRAIIDPEPCQRGCGAERAFVRPRRGALAHYALGPTRDETGESSRVDDERGAAGGFHAEEYRPGSFIRIKTLVTRMSPIDTAGWRRMLGKLSHAVGSGSPEQRLVVAP
jgi:hypothetical protein